MRTSTTRAARSFTRGLFTPALRTAATELASLPELAEASAKYAVGDFEAARAPLERAVQIVSGFPSPDYKLVVHGGLAQVLRATGEADREAALWEELQTHVSMPPRLHYYVLEGLAGCALQRAALDEAAVACEQALSMLAMEADLRAHWVPRFHLHRALGELSAGRAAEARAAAEAAAAAGESDGVAEARRGTREAAALLLGDALAASGDVAGALGAWGALGEPEGKEAGAEDVAAAAGGGGAALLRRHAALCRAGAAQLAGGEAAAAEASLKAAVALDGALSDGGGAAVAPQARPSAPRAPPARPTRGASR